MFNKEVYKQKLSRYYSVFKNARVMDSRFNPKDNEEIQKVFNTYLEEQNYEACKAMGDAWNQAKSGEAIGNLITSVQEKPLHMIESTPEEFYNDSQFTGNFEDELFDGVIRVMEDYINEELSKTRALEIINRLIKHYEKSKR